MKFPFTLLVALALICRVDAVWASTSQEMTQTLQKLKPFAESNVSVTLLAGDASVAVKRSVIANIKDLKIETLMAAKALMDLDGSLRAVTLRFSAAPTGRYVTVTATAAEIKAFSGGVVSADELLGSLRITEGVIRSATNNTPPQPVSKPADMKTAYENLSQSVSAQEAATANSAAAVTLVLPPGNSKKQQQPAAVQINQATLSGIMEKTMTMYLGAHQFRADYPWCRPAEGPFHRERGAVAFQLWQLHGKGYDINPYKKYFLEMESLAARREMGALKQSITNMYKALHITGKEMQNFFY